MNAFLLVLFFASITIAYGAIRFAPWLPTRRRDIERALSLADLKAGETFIDLGCGDGRVVSEAAKRGAQAIGYEIALPLYLACILRRNGRGARYFFKDLFRADVSKADVIYLFGTPPTLRGRLREKLERELKPGARVLSYAFAIDGWTPATVDKPEGTALPIYRYSR